MQGTVSKGNPRTLWSLWPINNGNSIAITYVSTFQTYFEIFKLSVSLSSRSAYSGDGICIEGSGGPLGGLPCSSVQQKAADQIVQVCLSRQRLLVWISTSRLLVVFLDMPHLWGQQREKMQISIFPGRAMRNHLLFPRVDHFSADDRLWLCG